MKKYLGVKIILAIPMMLNQAEELLKRKIQDNNEDGYLVEYEDGYKSWSPKEVFEKAYRKTDGLTFGLAIEAMKKCVENKREHYATLKRNYKISKKNAEGTHTAKDVKLMFLSQNGLCNGCNIVALANGGSNYPSNLQLLCPTCNTSKGAKDFEEWKKYKALISIV